MEEGWGLSWPTAQWSLSVASWGAAIPCAIEFTPTQASQSRRLRTGANLAAKGCLATDIVSFSTATLTDWFHCKAWPDDTRTIRAGEVVSAAAGV